MSAFYTNVDDSLIAAFTKLNTKSDNSSLVNDIISFIKLFKNGKYSKYGNIDQSSTTLRDCPVGAPLLSYFSNLYKNGKIIYYNGLNGPKNLEKVTEYTIDQFLSNYGLSTFYSISHWNVNWKLLGINWNN